MSRHIIVLSFIVVFPMFMLCGGDKGTNGPDPDCAIQKVEEANQALADVLYDLINRDDIDEPDDIDFSQPNQLYREALVCDANNIDANFGAGLTELLMLMVDPEVNATYDLWESFLDTASIFEPRSGGVSLNINSPGNLFMISPLLLGTYSVGMFKMALNDPPMISSIQDIVENEVFPRVNYAIEKLNVVVTDQNYTFIITPRMQGDYTEDPIEIDLTEVYVSLTQLHLIQSIGNLFISYNFDFVSYDSTGLEEALDQSSSFLGLRSGGIGHMASVKTSFLSAIDELELAINFLKYESDNQDDDLIIIGPNDIDEADLDSILAHLPDARDVLNSTYDVTEDFNDDGIDETVTFALGALFDNPIANFKQVLPQYTSHVERDSSWWYDYFYTGVITWEAQSFSEWIFPNPTFNGFLPDMTDESFKNTFGINAEDWDRVIRIEFDD